MVQVKLFLRTQKGLSTEKAWMSRNETRNKNKRPRTNE